MRSVVVLPQPDGPSRQANSPGRISKERSRNAVIMTPSADLNVFSAMSTLSGTLAPTGCMSFKGLHQKEFDEEHDRHEGQGIGENRSDVEELEIEMDLEADAVRAAEQFDHQDDLPDQRYARSRGGGEVGLQLRQQYVADAIERAEAIDGRHFLIPRLERSFAGIEAVVAMIDRLSLERKVPPTQGVWRDALDAVQGAEQPRLL